MKIKRDFVTNSSSVCYLIAAPNKEILDDMIDLIDKIDQMDDASNEGAGIQFAGNTIKKLNEYVQGRPWDWITKARGLEFIYMTEHVYKESKLIIEEGEYVLIANMDWNANHHFDDQYHQYVIKDIY